MSEWYDRFRRAWSGLQVMDAERFRDHVLALLGRQFPDRRFAATGNPLVVSSSGGEFGLQNLYADYRRQGLSEAELNEAVVERFTRILAALDERPGPEAPPWDEVRQRLRPQLMPAEYREQAPVLTFPFLEDVLIGVVVDSETGYAYVRQEDPPAWGQSPEEIYDLALENLSRACSGISMSFVPPPTALIGIETKDGYDAARILVPGMRKFAVEKLGEPFFAGIPNRDFLIMWSTFNPAEFHDFTREKLAKDFAEQSYPLTPTVLRVSRNEVCPAD